MAAQRICIVTGANQGIGFGVTEELCAKFNGIVYLTSRNEGRGKEAIEKLKKMGFSPRFHLLDIDSKASIAKFAEYIRNTYGGFDVLVNNAAMAYKMASTEPFAEQAENTIRVNYFGTLAMCEALFPLLRPHGRVVNVSSSAGHLHKIPDNEEGLKLRRRFAADDLTVEELNLMMEAFVQCAKEGTWREKGWPNSTYMVSKVGVSALSRIQQRAFDKDPREDLVVNHCHPGYIATEMSSYKGPMTIEQGSVAPTYLALLPENTELRGAYIWFDKNVVDWVNGPVPPYC